MKMWKDNKRDGEWEMSDGEIVRRFLASKYGDLDQYPVGADRALRAFLTDHEPDGLSSVWEPGDSAYGRIVDLVLDARRSQNQLA